ncbi:MAG: DNA-directed RNA polymerase subunit omega [Defluviitaleaceae bacterium]|nr:DNA-directed RNA polymerase subunit omega [Defluviitaleaceae bacterium]
MLKPSYSELMDVINTNELVDSKITSRYTIVLAAAKRARQIIDGANPLTYAPTDRAVSTAVKEMSEGKLAIKVSEELLEGNYERLLKDQYKFSSISAISKDDLREDLKDNYEPVTYGMDDDETEDDATLFRERYGDTDLREDKDEYNTPIYNDDDADENYEDED